MDAKKIYETKFKKAFAERNFTEATVLSIEYPLMKKYFTQAEAVSMLNVYENVLIQMAAMEEMIGAIEITKIEDLEKKINCNEIPGEIQ